MAFNKNRILIGILIFLSCIFFYNIQYDYIFIGIINLFIFLDLKSLFFNNKKIYYIFIILYCLTAFIFFLRRSWQESFFFGQKQFSMHYHSIRTVVDIFKKSSYSFFGVPTDNVVRNLWLVLVCTYESTTSVRTFPTFLPWLYCINAIQYAKVFFCPFFV